MLKAPAKITSYQSFENKIVLQFANNNSLYLLHASSVNINEQKVTHHSVNLVQRLIPFFFYFFLFFFIFFLLLLLLFLTFLS